MLYNMWMPRGASGRIVLEIDPGQKLTLYEVLDAEGMTLKDWFLKQLRSYTAERRHPTRFPHESPAARGAEGAHRTSVTSNAH